MCQGIFFMVFNIFFTRLSRRRHGRAHPPPSPRALRARALTFLIRRLNL